MKFIDAEDDIENLMMFRKVSEDGKIEIAIHPVLSGFRIVAGYVGDGPCKLNYCAGDEQPFVEHTYSLVWTILERGLGHFKDFPVQNFKVITSDPDCYNALLTLSGVMAENPEPPLSVSLPDLQQRKANLIRQHFENFPVENDVL